MTSMQENNVCRHDSTRSVSKITISRNLPKQKRFMRRMDNEQEAVLFAEYDRDSNWTNSHVDKLASRLGLTRTKVYKWNWDRRNKARHDPFMPNIAPERGLPNPMFPNA
jgi:hypothetical protein